MLHELKELQSKRKKVGGIFRTWFSGSESWSLRRSKGLIEEGAVEPSSSSNSSSSMS